jgi:hypothetical protein
MSLISFLAALAKGEERGARDTLSLLSAISKADPREHIDFSKATEEALRKEAPVGSDVHVSTALGEKPKKKNPAKSEDKESDDEGHLPVTNMTLAAQQLTGQAKQTNKFAGVLKVDESLGLVLGWAIVCKKDGCDYFDLQEDNIPETSMLSAAVDFMQNSRMAKEMHAGGAAGTVIFAFPLTEDIAKAFGIETRTTGLMIAMKPDSDDMLAKFRNGELTGFSIGGHRIDDEVVISVDGELRDAQEDWARRA